MGLIGAPILLTTNSKCLLWLSSGLRWSLNGFWVLFIYCNVLYRSSRCKQEDDLSGAHITDRVETWYADSDQASERGCYRSCGCHVEETSQSLRYLTRHISTSSSPQLNPTRLNTTPLESRIIVSVDFYYYTPSHPHTCTPSPSPAQLRARVASIVQPASPRPESTLGDPEQDIHTNPAMPES